MSTTYRELRHAVDALVSAEDAITLARQKHAEAQVRVGAALRAARERKGLSLRQCASRLKLSAPYLSDVELGRRGMTDGNLEMLMGIVGPPTMQDRFEAITRATKTPLTDDSTRIKSNTEVSERAPKNS
jgi:ribosome-binding protein aMBF1 (putative translation factor)